MGALHTNVVNFRAVGIGCVSGCRPGLCLRITSGPAPKSPIGDSHICVFHADRDVPASLLNCWDGTRITESLRRRRASLITAKAPWPLSPAGSHGITLADSDGAC